MGDYFGFNLHLESPKALQFILEETKVNEISGIAASGNDLAIYSNFKKLILLTNITGQVTKKILIPVDEKLEITINNIVWSKDNRHILVIIPSTLFIFDTETTEIIASCTPSASQNSFVDASYFSEDKIVSIDSHGNISLYSSSDLLPIKSKSVSEEMTCFSIYSNVMAIGTTKGKVLLFHINEESENPDEIFSKFDEIRATASAIRSLRITADNLYVSSETDTVMWSSEKKPLFAVKSRGEVIFPDAALMYGFSVVNETNAFMHILKKGQKCETSKKIEISTSEKLFNPTIHWINDETIRVIFANSKQIFICTLTKTIDA